MNQDRKRHNRRLAAVLAADVVGYARLMGEDEDGTLAALRRLRKGTLEPAVAAHNGTVVKRMGDGWLVEFASVVDAVDCARQVQQQAAEAAPIRLRIGVHLGDIVHEDEDIYGDGVNIAARLQEVAEPGGVAVSDDARRQLKGKQSQDLVFAGERRLKNIAAPMGVYRLAGPEDAVGDGVGAVETANGAAMDARPVIAVLPFDNMSGDPAQEYMADGITVDIITLLSKHRWLTVSARNTTFGYKGERDIGHVAAALNANYVVEGSVRRAGQGIRVSVQLIDGPTGTNLWAERYDRDMADIFEVQDQITDTIVARIEPEIGAAERRKVVERRRADLRAWDYYHLGTWHFFKFDKDDNAEAQRLLKRSMELDPNFGESHAWWAYAVLMGMVYWDSEPDQEMLDAALAAAERALEIDDQNALFYFMKARIQLARKEYASALAGNRMAMQLNPTYAAAYCGMGDSLAYLGRYDEAMPYFERAVTISPNDPQRWSFLSYGAMALVFKHDYAGALDWCDKAEEIPNRQYWTLAHRVVALAGLGREAEAAKAVAALLAEKPGFTCSFARQKLFYIDNPDQLATYIDGLRAAGVPA